MTDVTIQYFDDCPNWREVDQRLRQLQADGVDIELHYEIVDTPEKAERVGFRGSPTVLVDGVDPFAGVNDLIGLACRVYVTEGGYAGSPSVEQLEAAVAGR